MKISLLALAIVTAIAAGAFGAGRALATSSHATKTVKIVMHDPGCHWFKVHGKLTTKETVRANQAKLVNQDEAPLVVVNRQGMKQHIAVGKSFAVGHGNYVIMMVGQGTDDNYLRLHVG